MRSRFVFAAIAAIVFSCHVAQAQPPEGRGGPGFGGPPQHPLLVLLDENKDGEISQGEMEKAVAALKKLDQNGDGKLTREELPRPIAGGPGGPGGAPNPEEMMARLKRMDANGDGKLGKEELPERMQQNFSNLDANGDGFLDREELRRMMERMGGGFGGPPRGAPGGDARGEAAERGNMTERLMNLDANKDGKISKEEAPERLQGLFDRLDSNSDGSLDKEELKAAGERLRERTREKSKE